MEALGWIVALAVGVFCALGARRQRRRGAWVARMRAHWQAAAAARPNNGAGEAVDALTEGAQAAATDSIDRLCDWSS